MNILRFLLGSFIFFILLIQPVSAASSNLRLKIAPMDCVFEIVNDGRNEIRYLTPESCGQLITGPGTGVSSTEELATSPPIFRLVNSSTPAVTVGVFLNDFREFLSSGGIRINLNLHQIVRFNLSNESHSITLKEVGDDYAMLTIASTPYDTKLYVNETEQHDLTNDGKADVEITLNKISHGTADITFKKLTETAAQIPSDQQSNDSDKAGDYTAPVLLIAAVAIALGGSMLKRRASKR